MCLYPRLIKNRKYTKTKKNKGVIPPLPLIKFNNKWIEDKRVLEVPVGCGKCMECKKQKANEWKVRLHEDIKHNKNGIFVTLTFSNESIQKLNKEIPKKIDGYERNNYIAKLATRRFLERWRKKYKKSVRHWLVTELGHNGTENIHMHGIIWTNEEPKEIDKIWQYGYTWLSTNHKGYVSEKTVNYITKYIIKTDSKHQEYNTKILTSPGIGKNYTEGINAKNNTYKKDKTKETYTTNKGLKIALPIYYRNKIYNDEEKEKLWIEKLDKKIRYINGKEIDISKNEDEYYKILKQEQQRNARLGYGTNKKNWDVIKYERERANLNYKKRLKKT